jgi:C-terminal binding protein
LNPFFVIPAPVCLYCCELYTAVRDVATREKASEDGEGAGVHRRPSCRAAGRIHPELLRAYRAREPWCEGRLIITPHSAFFTSEAWDDTRPKAAETMRAALVGPRPQNVITPEMS